jgi:hypothetical protein
MRKVGTRIEDERDTGLVSFGQTYLIGKQFERRA